MPTFDLKIDLTKDNEKGFLEDISSASFKMPDMNSLDIINIGVDPDTVNRFLKIWVPEKLNYLNVNESLSSKDQIKMGEYLDSLVQVVNGVSITVELGKFIITSTEFENIIKFSKHLSSLKLSGWTIYCPSEFDFSISSKYKTQQLSFSNCKFYENSSGFFTKSSSLECMIDAIGKWGLKDSLSWISVSGSSYDKTKIQLMLNTKGMISISAE